MEPMVTHIYPKAEDTTTLRNNKDTGQKVQPGTSADYHCISQENMSVRPGPEPFLSKSHHTVRYSEESFKEIRDILFEREAFDLDSYKDKCIQRRISLRIRTSGCRTPDDYIDILKKDAAERKKLVSTLTISVTEFFRNHTTFAKLLDIVIPDIFGMKRNDKRIKIWSAGCASGEEPYSVAMTIRHFFPLELKNANLSILATDVDENNLKKAEAAVYIWDKLAGTNPVLVETYFEKKDDRYILSDEIKKMVSFRKVNILNGEWPGENDLIICRNLLIYFSREKQEWVLKKFFDSLNPGGYLVLGRAEILIGESRNMFSTICPKERIYRKPF